MRLSLAQIEAFHLVVQLGSVQAAAERLRLSSPTVSVRLRLLERELDRKLFERRGRKLEVTAAGAALVADAEQILGLARHIAGRISPSQVRLRLGATDSFAMVCLPEMLQRLEREFPELSVDITVENSVVLNRRINDGQLDIAFFNKAQVRDHVRSEFFGNQDDSWVASPRLALSSQRIKPRDLIDLQIFTNPKPSGLNEQVLEWFSRSNLQPARLSTCNSLAVVVGLTVAGAGVSLLPTAILQSELRSGLLHRLQARPAIARQPLFAAYHVDAAGRYITRMLELARDVLSRTRFLVA
jgi:DNA-binding transcriptional LysR family regulator